VLASGIGDSVPVDELLSFVRTCRLNFVVIDFAWITYHWPRADMEVIGDVCRTLQREGVQVAAMYRPRVLRPEEAPIHYAQNADGTIGRTHNDLCFAHEDSIAWAVQWGVQIRSALPSVDRIILYNLRPSCRCPDCRGGKGIAHVARFLARCRSECRKAAPFIQIGHVGVGDEYADAVDFFCPFLCVNRTAGSSPDFDREVARLVRLRSAHKDKPMIPLVKVCWEADTDNTSSDIISAIRKCDAAGTGFVLWYYEWIFRSADHRYDRKAIVESLGGDWRAVARYFPASRPSTRACRIRSDPQTREKRHDAVC